MQLSRVLLLLGFSALACQKPDHQPPVEPTARVASGPKAVVEPTGSAASGAKTAESLNRDDRCVVPLPAAPKPPVAAAASCPTETEGNVKFEHGLVTFVDAPSHPTVQVEVARSDANREHGLMYRKKLDSESGMLFVWKDESPRTFWMHNTCIPLDMLFIAKDGTVAGVLEQVPVLNDEPRGVPCPAAYVLEVNAGWTRGHKVAPGQHVSVSLP